MQQDGFISIEQAFDRDPIVVSPETRLTEVVKLMSRGWTNSCLLSENPRVTVAQTHDGYVLAIADSQLLGIFTERDLVRLISSRQNWRDLILAEVMNRDVVTLTPTESEDIFAALNLLCQHQISHLPIVDERRCLQGLITQESLRQALQLADLLKFRRVKEVMSRAIHAAPTASVLSVARLMSDYRVSSIPIAEANQSDGLLRPLGIITERDLVQFQLLELNLAGIEAQTVMSTPLFLARPEDSLWTVQQQLERQFVRRLVVVGEGGELLGIITQSNLLRAIDHRELHGTLAILQGRANRLERERIETLQRQNFYLTNQVAKQTTQLQERSQQERLVATIALRIRQSLDLESILNTTVEEVRELIDTDRALIYRFEPDWSGIVTNESVSDSQWSILGRVVRDSCFEEAWLESYQYGHIHANDDIYRANLSQCHIEFLSSFQVKANIAIPILLTDADARQDRLWGLLIVHQCSSPRNWQESELELLKLLSSQVAIAIQQGELYQQVQNELARRQQAEAEIRESESRFRAIAHTAPVMIWISGTDKRCNFFNQSWLEFRGRSREAELGNGWTEGVHPADRQRCWDIYSSAFDRRQEFVMEYRLQRADGEYRWILDRGVPRFTESGEFTGYIGSCMDIGGRKQAEATIRERETQLRTALDAAALGTWSWNIRTNEVVLCERSQSFFGFNEAEFPGTLAAALDRIHGEDRQRLDEKVTAAIAQEGLYEIEARVIRPDDTHRWLSARGHVLQNSESQPVLMVGVIADVTEKKRLEEQSLRTQRLESLGALAGGIAHDLNNIFTPILMSVQLLPVTIAQIDPRSRELIQMLESNVKRGSALVQQVLSFARGIEGERGIVQVKHIIEDIRQFAIETFPKAIEIKTNISPNLWTIKGDASQIHQILLNLAINAKDAMLDGGLLNISAANLSIDQQYVREHPQLRVGSHIAISVTDTGKGISPENLEQIFEPFFSTKKNDGGTGLGLATVKKIVESHHGAIDVVSQVGQGTQFNVILPASATPETEFTERLVIPKGRGELILVADDEATIREITRASLETHNYRVITAEDGIEAIASYVRERDEIALVLINMMMPVMDGATTILTLQKINPSIKIVAISGKSFSNRTMGDRQLKITSFLAKPYSTETLLQTISEVINSD